MKRSVRQGHTISSTLFISALDDMFRDMDWSGNGLNTGGEYEHHLRLADDVVLMNDSKNMSTVMLFGRK